ncbi:MAG: hypothetical protein HPY83_03605 [Anaerolineae bacterium]|nr:hypothetical protein [Anaerolineae bacterium]
MSRRPGESADRKDGQPQSQEPRPRLVGKRVERTDDGRYVILYYFEDEPDREQRR